MKNRPLRYVIAEQVVGWGAIGGAVVESTMPAIFAFDLSTAGGLGVFGVLMVTGRVNRALKALAAAIDGLRS